MKELSVIEFKKLVCENHFIELFKYDYLIPDKNKIFEKEALKNFCKGFGYCITIIDVHGKRHKFISRQISKKGNSFFGVNHKALEDAYILERKTVKDIGLIFEEAEIKLISKSVRISEGGGFSSNGQRYVYKNFYCESSYEIYSKN